MTKDFLTVLTHNNISLSKVWKEDDSKPDAFGKQANFKHREIEVGGIRELSMRLSELEKNIYASVVRDKFLGLAHAKEVLGTEFKPGQTRKLSELFTDVPHHWVMFDVDGYAPTSCDPWQEPLRAMEEYIATNLPDPFQGATYHWQLSNTHMHPLYPGVLKCHLWFWLDTAYTSAQMQAWVDNNRVRVDRSLFTTVQWHYTTIPTMSGGRVDPAPVRSGMAEGLFSDDVRLVLDEHSLAAVNTKKASSKERLEGIQRNDPVALKLEALGMIKSKRKDGGLNIECPRSEFHSSESGESSTIYYLPHTGGFEKGAFKCAHGGCVGARQGEYLAALGINPLVDDFEIVPEKTGGVRKKVPEAQHLTTDQANAQRITSHFKSKMISAADKWFAWNGQRWEQDDNMVYMRAMSLSKIIHAEADVWSAKPTSSGEEKEKNDKVADALRSWAKKSEMRGAIESALYLAKRALGVNPEDLDSNPFYLNCANGTVDLRTGKMQPHNPDDLITKLSPQRYDPNNKAVLFDSVLGKVTMEENRRSRPLADFLKRWFGYCATGSVREQKFVVHYGGGRNGKSTILDSIAEVLGDYAGTAAPGLIAGGSKERHPTEIADLFNKRMVTAHESGEGNTLHEDFVKQATGGDKLKARYMRADFFEFYPTHKLQLLTNYKPQIRGQDEGIWRRVLLVPYMVRFGSPEEVASGVALYVRDTTIAEHLAKEKDAILTWLVEGAVEWYRDGLNPPDIVLEASKDYQSEQDRVLLFVNECCDTGREYRECITVGRDRLYDTYKKWCEDSGYHYLAKKKLQDEITRIVPYAEKKQDKTSGRANRRSVMFMFGIRVKDEFDVIDEVLNP